MKIRRAICFSLYLIVLSETNAFANTRPSYDAEKPCFEFADYALAEGYGYTTKDAAAINAIAPCFFKAYAAYRTDRRNHFDEFAELAARPDLIQYNLSWLYDYERISAERVLGVIVSISDRQLLADYEDLVLAITDELTLQQITTHTLFHLPEYRSVRELALAKKGDPTARDALFQRIQACTEYCEYLINHWLSDQLVNYDTLLADWSGLSDSAKFSIIKRVKGRFSASQMLQLYPTESLETDLALFQAFIEFYLEQLGEFIIAFRFDMLADRSEVAVPVTESDWRTISRGRSPLNDLLAKLSHIPHDQKVLVFTKLAATGDTYLMLKSALELIAIDIAPSIAQVDLITQDKMPEFWFTNKVARLRSGFALAWVNDHLNFYNPSQQCELVKKVTKREEGLELEQVVNWLEDELPVLPQVYPAKVENEKSFKPVEDRYKGCDPLDVMIKIISKPHPVSLRLAQKMFELEHESIKFIGAVGLLFNNKNTGKAYFNEWLKSSVEVKSKIAKNVLEKLNRDN